jgi:hypothetical protein
MSVQLRYQLSRIIVLLTVPSMLYCLSKMIPAGISGDTPKVVRWFGIFSLTAVAGVIGFVVMQYTKARQDAASNDETEILARTMADLAREKKAAADPAKGPASTPGP